MSRSDWLLLALNAAAALVSILIAVDFVEAYPTAYVGLLFVPAFALMASSVALIRRAERDKEATHRDASDNAGLDAREVLDLDARLEALERAQVDAVDAARWRALVESGQVSAPAMGAPAADGPGHTRNGQRG